MPPILPLSFLARHSGPDDAARAPLGNMPAQRCPPRVARKPYKSIRNGACVSLIAAIFAALARLRPAKFYLPVVRGVTSYSNRESRFALPDSKSMTTGATPMKMLPMREGSIVLVVLISVATIPSFSPRSRYSCPRLRSHWTLSVPRNSLSIQMRVPFSEE